MRAAGSAWRPPPAPHCPALPCIPTRCARRCLDRGGGGSGSGRAAWGADTRSPPEEHTRAAAPLPSRCAPALRGAAGSAMPALGSRPPRRRCRAQASLAHTRVLGHRAVRAVSRSSLARARAVGHCAVCAVCAVQARARWALCNVCNSKGASRSAVTPRHGRDTTTDSNLGRRSEGRAKCEGAGVPASLLVGAVADRVELVGEPEPPPARTGSLGRRRSALARARVGHCPVCAVCGRVRARSERL